MGSYGYGLYGEGYLGGDVGHAGQIYIPGLIAFPPFQIISGSPVLMFDGSSFYAPTISAGDHVQVITHGGIECTVFIDSGTPVKVVIASTKQISIVIKDGVPIRVTI